MPSTLASIPKTAVPLTFFRRVDAFRAGADQFEFGRRLQLHVRRDRQLGSIACDVAEAHRPLACIVVDHTTFDAAALFVDVPLIGGRRHEHGSCGCAGLAKPDPVTADRI